MALPRTELEFERFLLDHIDQLHEGNSMDDEEIKDELLAAGVAMNRAMDRARKAGIDVRMEVVDFEGPPPRKKMAIDLTGWGVYHQLVLSGDRTKTVTTPVW